MGRRKTLGINPLDALIPPAMEATGLAALDAAAATDLPTAAPPARQERSAPEPQKSYPPLSRGSGVELPPPPSTADDSSFGIGAEARNETARTGATAAAPATVRARVVETERLVLTDERGVVRASLGCGEEGEVVLRLQDGTARPRVEVRVSDDGGTALVLLDAEHAVRALLGADESGKSNLILGDRNDRPRVALGVLDDGRCYVRLFHEDGSTPLMGWP